MKRIKGVSRPAIATTLPVPDGPPKVLLDSGAMADCQPDWLQQFARMGSAFSQVRYDLQTPVLDWFLLEKSLKKATSW